VARLALAWAFGERGGELLLPGTSDAARNDRSDLQGQAGQEGRQGSEPMNVSGRLPALWALLATVTLHGPARRVALQRAALARALDRMRRHRRSHRLGWPRRILDRVGWPDWTVTE